nr:protein mono-ADP-ribosyltransferase PARP12-like isoform X1 [Cherax quadricarinatus]
MVLTSAVWYKPVSFRVMAGQWEDRQGQQLKQSADAIADMLKQLQRATMDPHPSRGGYFRGRSRGTYQRGRNPEQRNVSSPRYGNKGRGSQGYYPSHWQPPEGSWQPPEGSWQPPEGSWQPPEGSWQPPEGSWQPPEGSWRSPEGSWRPPERSWRQQGEYKNSPPYNPYKKATRVTPRFLVEYLARSHTFSASLLQLVEDKGLQPSSVRDMVSSWTKIFVLNNEAVELKPQIKICTAHSGTQGCLKRSSCSDLHLCPNFVLNCCREKNCVLGHKWMTDHNMTVLKEFFLDSIPIPALRRLIQSLSNPSDTATLDVCRSYNEGGCNQPDCGQLHVCLSFVVRLTKCSHSDCDLNHDLQSPDCCQLLKNHGFSVNESPRDILVALLSANPSLSKEPQSSSKQDINLSVHSSPTQTSEKVVNKDLIKTKKLAERNKKSSRGKASDSSRSMIDKKGKHSSSESESSSKTEDEGESDSESSSKTGEESESESEKSNSSLSDEENGSERYKKSDSEMFVKKSKSLDYVKKKKLQKSNIDTPKDESPGSSKKNDSGNHVESPHVKQESHRTLWSHYLQGNVSIPEICYYSVEEMCKFEGSGCQRLHSTQHFHWQVSEQGNRWLNLRTNQVTSLERAYCDPSQDGVDLPRLDPSTLDISVGGLLILMGRDVWHADFKAMKLTNSSNTKTLHIRRLCTEVVSGQVIKPSTFIWYFLDRNNKWVKYGNVDTVGETNLVSSVTTDDIEKHFKQNPSVSLAFKNSQFTYDLNFNTMTQTNQKTGVSREVRRRPDPHLADEKTEKKKDQKSSIDLPSDWEAMQPEQRMHLVPLAPTSAEYLTVIGLLAGKIQTSQVVKVERIQNPFLWRALQNKIKELTAVYGDASKVDIRQLFHGTGHDVVASICVENFDWRLHGSASGQMYGRGTYFSTDAAYSYNYSRPDSTGMKYMFVARTAVGSITRGSSSMVRPPTNPATNLPFDSTVNDELNPTIIVKYDKQEYYPEYILTMT